MMYDRWFQRNHDILIVKCFMVVLLKKAYLHTYCKPGSLITVGNAGYWVSQLLHHERCGLRLVDRES